MLFNSHLFLLVFLPLVFIIFELAPSRYRLWVLCLASLVFYGYAGLKPLGAMLVSIIWVYGVTTYVQNVPRTLARLLVIVVPLATLILFRYLDFALDILGVAESSRQSFSFFLDILVPAGISFYTFQVIAYGIDVIDEKITKENRLLTLVTFISFFPQLVAGPIVRYGQIRDQFEAISQGRTLARNFTDAAQWIAIGLAYKVFVADMMGILHVKVSAANGGTIDVWLSVIIYSFQIYYDFYSYSLIAIGLGKLFGIDLPINFDRPYMALNPREFWKRWHITLSSWLRDYVYIRMGGNKHYVRNIIIVFAAVGLWHGPNWNFVVWGLYHALLVTGYKLINRFWDHFPAPVQIGACFLLVSLGWPLFYLDLTGYMALLPRLITVTDDLRQIYQIQEIAYVAFIALWTFLPITYSCQLKGFLWTLCRQPACQATLIAVSILMFGITTDFIYFRF